MVMIVDVVVDVEVVIGKEIAMVEVMDEDYLMVVDVVEEDYSMNVHTHSSTHNWQGLDHRI